MSGTISGGVTVGKRAVEIGTHEGPRTLVDKVPPFVYEQLRTYLPKRGRVELNDVESSLEKGVLDEYLPGYLTRYVQTDDPFHEALYVGAIREHVERGEVVVAIGGGEGVSTVVAARQVGPEGRVITYEGGREEVAKTRETACRNAVEDRVTVEHAIVSTDYLLRSSGDDAAVVTPAELPSCDTLAIDADGAELPILEELAAVPAQARPNQLVVEHHTVLDDGTPVFEYQPAALHGLIDALGYDVVTERTDPNRAYGRFEERVVVAER